MPLLIRQIGVGTGAQRSWLTVMSILSVIAIPATLIEYYFTVERVTLDANASNTKMNIVSFGKQITACFRDRYSVTIIGFSIAALGSLAVLLGGSNMTIVLGGLLVKSTGALPTYVMAALPAEALDYVELKNGFRADGFSASVNSIIQTVVLGLAQTLLLAGINAFGYIVPESSVQIIAQPDAVLQVRRSKSLLNKHIATGSRWRCVIIYPSIDSFPGCTP